MSQPSIPQIRYSWRLPVVCSLLLHGGLIVPLFFQTLGTDSAAGDGMAIDTIVLEGQTDVTVTLDGGAASAKIDPKPITPSPSIRPNPIETASLSPPMPNSTSSIVPALPSSSAPQIGMSEAQEEPVANDTGRKARRGGGKGTSFFHVGTEARSIVYVIDRSASMGLDGSYDAAKHELLASLEQLPDTARFQIIIYNRTAEPLPISGKADLVLATLENKRQAGLLLQRLYAEGGTDHVRALRRALALQPEVIFFFTDADNLQAEQIRAVTLFNHGRSIIHAIELDSPRSGSNTHPLRVLADQNQGIYRSVTIAPR